MNIKQSIKDTLGEMGTYIVGTTEQVHALGDNLAYAYGWAEGAVMLSGLVASVKDVPAAGIVTGLALIDFAFRKYASKPVETLSGSDMPYRRAGIIGYLRTQYGSARSVAGQNQNQTTSS
jgi:hypothetical protein